MSDIQSEIKQRKLWPYVEANKALVRHRYEPSYTYCFESGFGPSGFPHIGTFGEVVRTEFIINALKAFGFKTKLIAFSDDLDGLRKAPEDMPKWIKEFLGKPVSSVPDPFDKFSSFSEHMNHKLKEMLDWMEIDYQFQSSKDAYESGQFDEALKILLANYQKLESIIAPTLSKETLENWHPFFPICENCGKVLTTIVNHVNLEDYTVRYTCAKSHGAIEGCGHEGVQTALKGRGKMTWRVDWPMRWYALNVDYELYGKDLIDSFTVGKKIMKQIFHAKEPENMFYEMFLDENGAKISKSKGEGLTVNGWLKYGNAESLYLLMYRQPKKSKELSFGIIPAYVDDVIGLAKNYHQDPSKPEHDFHFIMRFQDLDKTFPNVSYMLICNLMSALQSTDKALIKTYLYKQKDLTEADINGAFLDQLIDKAAQYYQDFIEIKRSEIRLTAEDASILNQFTALLSQDLDSEQIHNSVYEIAQNAKREPREAFKIIYLALTRQDRGPRIGNFVKMIGQDKTIEIINASIKEYL